MPSILFEPYEIEPYQFSAFPFEPYDVTEKWKKGDKKQRVIEDNQMMVLCVHRDYQERLQRMREDYQMKLVDLQLNLQNKIERMEQ